MASRLKDSFAFCPKACLSPQVHMLLTSRAEFKPRFDPCSMEDGNQRIDVPTSYALGGQFCQAAVYSSQEAPVAPRNHLDVPLFPLF